MLTNAEVFKGPSKATQSATMATSEQERRTEIARSHRRAVNLASTPSQFPAD